MIEFSSSLDSAMIYLSTDCNILILTGLNAFYIQAKMLNQKLKVDGQGVGWTGISDCTYSKRTSGILF